MKSSKKIIYINGRFLSQKVTGVQRFAFTQVSRLANSFHVVVLCPKNINQSNIKNLPSSIELKIIGFYKGHLWEQICLPLYLIRNGSPQIISFSGLSPILYTKNIFTIHDLSFRHNRDWFSLGYYLWYSIAYALLLRTSCRVITVSEFSKSEILKYYSVEPSKIKVVYNTVPEFQQGSQIKNLKNEKYILTVSSLEPRKNLQLLIDAFTELNIDHVQLYIVGTTNKVFNFSGFTDLTSSNVKFLGYVSDQELEALYRGAEFFVYPSLYEGFGLPPTEAISYGTPILCSDIDSIKEVCGDVPEYFHTNDLSHLKKMIVSMLETPKSKEIYSLEAEKQLLLLKTKQERYSILNAIDE